VFNVIRAHLAKFGIVASIGRKGIDELLDACAGRRTKLANRLFIRSEYVVSLVRLGRHHWQWFFRHQHITRCRKIVALSDKFLASAAHCKRSNSESLAKSV
jgi:hypothetical protein